MRRVVLAASLVLAVIGASSAGALAAATDTLKLRAPSYVDAGQPFHVKVTGTATKLSHLTVFIATRRCALSVPIESQRSSHVIMSRNVLHVFTRSRAVRAREGTHHVCAYLTPVGRRWVTRARAALTYYGLAGAY